MLRIRTQAGAVPDAVVLYPGCLVVLEGASIMTLLRASLAGEDLGTLACKQWAIDAQTRCCDVIPCGERERESRVGEEHVYNDT